MVTECVTWSEDEKGRKTKKVGRGNGGKRKRLEEETVGRGNGGKRKRWEKEMVEKETVGRGNGGKRFLRAVCRFVGK